MDAQSNWRRGRQRPDERTKAARKHRPDYLLFIIPLAMLVVGLIIVYSIGPGLAAIKQVGDNYYVQKQAIAIVLGLCAFAVTSYMPPSRWRKLVRPLVAATAVSVAAVSLLGDQVNGASRWIQVGGFSFQSAELIKFSLVILVADFLARRRGQLLIANTRKTLYYILALMGLVGIVVAGMQSDLGSAVVMAVMIFIMSMLAGLPVKKLLLIGGVVAIGLSLAVVATPYRRARVATFLHPTADCQNTGYQSCQALIAIGSGGMFGKGLGNSVQAYGYLPEAANDSIFAIYGEKFGFLGTLILVAMYGVFFSRIRRVIDHISDDFQRFVAIGVLAWLSTQTIINIGAMIGLLPLKGITLPFISYGGTSLLFTMAAAGLVFAISRYSAYAPVPLEAIHENINNGGPYDNFSRRGRVRRAHHAQLSRRSLH